jgi:hypothetical protein
VQQFPESQRTVSGLVLGLWVFVNATSIVSNGIPQPAEKIEQGHRSRLDKALGVCYVKFP